MVIVSVDEENGSIKKIKFEGHAAPIVCSAISTLAIATANYIDILNGKVLYEDDGDTFLTFTVQKSNNTIDQILKYMVAMLGDIEEEYPKDIKIMRD